MPATEVIRIRVTPEEKELLRERSASNGRSMSEEVRAGLGLGEGQTPVQRYREVMGRIRQAQSMVAYRPMSEDEVLAYVDQVRAQRASAAMEQVIA